MFHIFNLIILPMSKSKFSLQRLSTFTKCIYDFWKIDQIGLFQTRTFSVTKTAMTSNVLLFTGNKDRFKGITVDSNAEQCDIQEFSNKLKGSLESWTKNGNRGIWFRVHLNQADWVPILAKNGFKFHHAKEEYVMMVLWLPTSEINNIPHFAHTMIGVGAVVINENNQVLVVSEKYYPVDMPHFKLPGGYVEPGENLIDAAIREVYEETSIKTEFESILTFRHGHTGMFGCSDIYTVVHLKAITTEIEKCDREIVECKWLDVSDYLNHPHIHELNKFFVRKYLEYEKRGIKINCYHGIHEILNKPFTVYSVTNRDVNFTNKNVDISKM